MALRLPPTPDAASPATLQRQWTDFVKGNTKNEDTEPDGDVNMGVTNRYETLASSSTSSSCAASQSHDDALPDLSGDTEMVEPDSDDEIVDVIGDNPDTDAAESENVINF